MSYRRKLAMSLLRDAIRGRPIPAPEARVALAELEGRDEPTKLPASLLGLQVIALVASHQARTGLPPTYAHMAVVLDRAKSTIHAQVMALEERGYVRLVGPKRARNITLTQKAVRALKPTTKD